MEELNIYAEKNWLSVKRRKARKYMLNAENQFIFYFDAE